MSHAAVAASLALAIGPLSFITSTATISKVPRVWIAHHSQSKFGGWINDLVSCSFCTGTWLALAATAVYRPLLVHLWWPLDYFVTALAIAGTSSLPVVIIRKAVMH